MSLTALLKEAGVSVKVSKENIAEAPLVQETVVSPVDSPSASIPVVETVATPAPVIPAPIVDSVVAPVEEVAADVVTDVAVVDQLPPAVPVVQEGVPVGEVQSIVADAVADVQVEATGAILEAEQCAIADKADELLEIQTALENMTTIIRKTGANGVSNQTAEMIQLQLASINRKLGVTSAFVSTESFNARDPRSQHENATIALESIKTSLKVARNNFVELIERLIAFFKKMAHNYLDGVNGLEKKVDQLDQRLGALKKTGEGGSITVANAGPVLFNDSWDIPTDIKGLAHFTARAYPDAVIKYLDKSAKILLKHKGENFDRERLVEEFEQEAKPLQHLIDVNVKDDKLPGGYHMDVSEDGMTFGIGGEGEQVDSKELDLLSTSELRKKVRVIKDIISQLKEIRPEVDNIDKAARRMIEASHRATEGWGKDQEQAKEYLATVGDVLARSSASRPRVGEVIKYLTRYLGMQLAIVGKMADAIEAEKKED